jgi:hypothetical protein
VQVAGIVDADHAGPLILEARDRQGCRVYLEVVNVADVQVEQAAKEDAAYDQMGNDDHLLVRVLSFEAVEQLHNPSMDIVQSFALGKAHRVRSSDPGMVGVGVAGFCLGSTQAGELTIVEIQQSRLADRLYAQWAPDYLRRLNGPGQRGSVDGMGSILSGQARGYRLRLLDPDLVERQVRPATVSFLLIPVGLTVANNQKQRAHAPSPTLPAYIGFLTKSLYGQRKVGHRRGYQPASELAWAFGEPHRLNCDDIITSRAAPVNPLAYKSSKPNGRVVWLPRLARYGN